MRAVIYCRVSSDQTGDHRSVESQEAECRAICQHHGWDVAEVLVDNDRGASRYSTRDRPEYKRLAQILKPGDVLVTWEASRAQRDLAAYVELRDLCAERGVLWSYSGKLHNLSQGDGRFATGLDALLAEREAEQIRERVLRGKRAAAEAGRPAGRPPWGYRRQIDPETGRTQTWVIDETDGPIVMEVIQRVLDGESLWSIVKDLKKRGIKPRQVQKNAATEWRPQPLRVTLCSPSYAGLRKHQGEVVGKGNWQPMISEEDHETLVAILTDPARRTNTHRGLEPKHLLTGIATCGVCGSPMRYFGPKTTKTATYLCSGGNCTRRRADAVDLLVERTIVKRMSRPDAIKFFAQQGSGDMKKAMAEVKLLKSRLDGFIDEAAEGELSPQALARIEAKLLRKIAAAEAEVKSSVDNPIVVKLAGPDAAEIWQGYSIVQRRTAVRSLLAVKILRTSARGGNVAFIPEDVDIQWHIDQQAAAV